jgi:hypothetical protein
MTWNHVKFLFYKAPVGNHASSCPSPRIPGKLITLNPSCPVVRRYKEAQLTVARVNRRRRPATGDGHWIIGLVKQWPGFRLSSPPARRAAAAAIPAYGVAVDLGLVYFQKILQNKNSSTFVCI